VGRGAEVRGWCRCRCRDDAEVGRGEDAEEQSCRGGGAEVVKRWCRGGSKRCRGAEKVQSLTKPGIGTGIIRSYPRTY
jgi:hypothetical protein